MNQEIATTSKRIHGTYLKWCSKLGIFLQIHHKSFRQSFRHKLLNKSISVVRLRFMRGVNKIFDLCVLPWRHISAIWLDYMAGCHFSILQAIGLDVVIFYLLPQEPGAALQSMSTLEPSCDGRKPSSIFRLHPGLMFQCWPVRTYR